MKHIGDDRSEACEQGRDQHGCQNLVPCHKDTGVLTEQAEDLLAKYHENRSNDKRNTDEEERSRRHNLIKSLLVTRRISKGDQRYNPGEKPRTEKLTNLDDPVGNPKGGDDIVAIVQGVTVKHC